MVWLHCGVQLPPLLPSPLSLTLSISLCPTLCGWSPIPIPLSCWLHCFGCILIWATASTDMPSLFLRFSTALFLFSTPRGYHYFNVHCSFSFCICAILSPSVAFCIQHSVVVMQPKNSQPRAEIFFLCHLGHHFHGPPPIQPRTTPYFCPMTFISCAVDLICCSYPFFWGALALSEVETKQLKPWN